MSETPERPHRTGFFWLDFLVAASAVVISVVSLFVAQRADRTQERLLAASTWPYVEFSSSNIVNNRSVITLTIRNAGVGPARIRWMTIQHNGKAAADSHDLLRECCGFTLAPHPKRITVISNTVTRTVLVPHETVNFVTVMPNPGNTIAFNKLNRERNNLEVRVCYCSVLDECWLLESTSADDPRNIANCNPPSGVLFQG